ncbi:sensor histidine kinase [Clostridium botulinum]|uniref:sensor histidine kinase n=1 Tax=Clostridium botulinum TaxID=1491 RepID=UPI00077452FD|nr:HAMP domain-containing sensor histidine kinase [Clostridium botulinum]MBY6951130.1 HAMP domain-containing histidine kinase [Clostridium botulinum]MCR1140523.1 HAMP domain-containing histidine kinase [Clostridium botulinum]MCR1165248.1 HAMP domain-containing histidine kinase [Clostridium botulinum]NEZ79495.1 HAMP domain-containing histidine kinase [Clostridium botulinum]NFA15596.1 HAMP domain-containing histidine kinase [Clostridium botulinum]
MKMSLKKKLSLGFLIAVIGSIIIASSISNYMINNRFNEYLVQEHKNKINQIIVAIEDMYKEDKGFQALKYDEIKRYAVLNELYIEIKDKKGSKIFTSGDDHLKHRSMMNSMMGHGMGSMMGKMKNLDLGDYKEEEQWLKKNNVTFGKITIGYFGTSYLSNGALTFKRTLNHSFIVSMVITFILGLILSWILSKQLSKPLVKIKEIANTMRMGNLNIRSNIKSNTTEIQELSNSINYLAETLQQQEALRKRLTSDMAHEIRTPITTLKTHVEAIIDGIWEPTEERLQVFYEELERLTNLVNNLRNISKLEKAETVVNKTNLNITKEIEKVVETFNPLYEKSGFKIVIKLEKDVYGFIDKDKLKQIMHNLLSNSHKYLNEDGLVKVSLSKGKDKIFIKVEDNGEGIPKEDLPHIFERFYRSDVSRNKTTGGTGLGLTITKTLVEAHGGHIRVESKMGVGTKFIIEIKTTL